MSTVIPDDNPLQITDHEMLVLMHLPIAPVSAVVFQQLAELETIDQAIEILEKTGTRFCHEYIPGKFGRVKYEGKFGVDWNHSDSEVLKHIFDGRFLTKKAEFYEGY